MKVSRLDEVLAMLGSKFAPEMVKDEQAPVRKCLRYLSNRRNQLILSETGRRQKPVVQSEGGGRKARFSGGRNPEPGGLNRALMAGRRGDRWQIPPALSGGICTATLPLLTSASGVNPKGWVRVRSPTGKCLHCCPSGRCSGGERVVEPAVHCGWEWPQRVSGDWPEGWTVPRREGSPR